MARYDLDVAIIGAGTSGMAAYREARRFTDRIALIEGGAFGTTCARVGCMPSKLLIAAATAAHQVRSAGRFGVMVSEPKIDGAAVMARVRAERDRFVAMVIEAVDEFDDGHVVRQRARFADDHTLALDDGRRLTARAIVIATGSRPKIVAPLKPAGIRLITSEDVFEWQDLPRAVAVFGAGVVGLELGQALHRLGVDVTLFERGDSVGVLSDPEVKACAAATFGAEFAAHWNVETTIDLEADQVVVRWTDKAKREQRFDYLLAATGRRPNLDDIGIENTSIVVDADGVPEFDRLSMRAGTSPIFIAGDASVDVPLLHEAADEGRIAGENAARFPEVYGRTRRTALGIVFSDPQLGAAGESHAELERREANFVIGEVRYENQGRARVMGIDKGLLRVYGERGSGRLLGAEMIGPAAEHLLHLLAWSIASRLTVSECLQRPFYHPTLEEGLRTALRELDRALGFGRKPPEQSIDCGPGC